MNISYFANLAHEHISKRSVWKSVGKVWNCFLLFFSQFSFCSAFIKINSECADKSVHCALYKNCYWIVTKKIPITISVIQFEEKLISINLTSRYWQDPLLKSQNRTHSNLHCILSMEGQSPTRSHPGAIWFCRL